MKLYGLMITKGDEEILDNPHRTGLPFSAARPEDLFVASIPDYGRCDRFDGTLPYPWNLGEEFRPSARQPIRPLRRS
jgi:hypothetical protein